MIQYSYIYMYAIVMIVAIVKIGQIQQFAYI